MALFTDRKFELVTPFQPTGDQPTAIEGLLTKLRAGAKESVLLGATGTGKTFTMASVIAKHGKPTLIMCHNKLLAAQLYSEMREFFPNNAVEYFVSYYDYYQPEAYIPQTDTYIEKDSQINDEIDKLRHSATRSLLERNDVVIVSSVSCIYGLGSPDAYEGMLLVLQVGVSIQRQDVLKKLLDIQYKRNDIDFHRGTFRVRGDVVEVYPAYEEDRAIRIEFFGDEVESISEVDPLRGIKLTKLPRITIYPASHYVTDAETRKTAMTTIREELRERLAEYHAEGRVLEAQRLEQRTLFDLEMIEAIGFCQGIENYSRHLTGRPPNAAPPTLLEYFPTEWLLIIDESHATVPQIGGMYRGDRARKMTLVEHGFRLPSALDNRPLNFEEFQACLDKTLYVSATPGEYELKRVVGEFVEQVIRPTGLLDPLTSVRPATTQIDDLLSEIRTRTLRSERVLVTVLTKRLAEDLTKYYSSKDVKVKYLHSDIETMDRIEILRDLRMGTFDVLIGINLLREGLDLPEVSLVAILDADKEGFLRSSRSLIQTIGRAARNSNGQAILYADKMTDSMKYALSETERRRKIQEAYNLEHGISPMTIQKAIRELIVAPLDGESGTDQSDVRAYRGGGSKSAGKAAETRRILGSKSRSSSALYRDQAPELPSVANLDSIDLTGKEAIAKELGGEFYTGLEKIHSCISKMETAMKAEAKALQFEKAATLRDRLKRLKLLELTLG